MQFLVGCIVGACIGSFLVSLVSYASYERGRKDARRAYSLSDEELVKWQEDIGYDDLAQAAKEVNEIARGGRVSD